MLNTIHTRIALGIEKPVRLLQITDVHLTYVTEDDLPVQRELMPTRVETFHKDKAYPPRTTEEYFIRALDLAKELDALPILTGDIVDLPTRGNLDAFRRAIAGRDLMFTPGGHEYQRVYVRTMEEPDGFAEKSRARLAKELPGFDLDFDSRVIGGVNIITANNALDYYNAYTARRFAEELERGYPIVVFSHDPINDPRLYYTEPYHPNVRLSAEDYRVSGEMRDAILHDPRVITSFAGHTHKQQEDTVEGKTHYVTPGLFSGVCRLIEIV